MGSPMSTRQIALAAGVVGAVLGIAAMVTNAAALGLTAGLLALSAGVLAVAGRPSAPRVHPEVEQAYQEATAELATARKVLDEQRSRILELEATVGEAEADPVAAVLGEGAVLTDPDTGLFSEPYFRVALDARIASARRHLRPVAVAFLDVAEGQVAGTAVAAPSERVAEAVRTTVRDADTACRMADGTFAIILEDTPENGAVWTVERVRRNLVSHHCNHTLWAGVACYPAHAFTTDEIVGQARRALDAAREWRQDRIEVAIAD
ncbi:MAG: GGDEF domain-containing protein [Actinomycetes bacterium]